jgi:hypothetical protein
MFVAIWKDESSKCQNPFIYCRYILECRRFLTSSPYRGPIDVVPSRVSASGPGSRSSLVQRVGASNSPTPVRPPDLARQPTHGAICDCRNACAGLNSLVFTWGSRKGSRLARCQRTSTSWLAHEVERPRLDISKKLHHYLDLRKLKRVPWSAKDRTARGGRTMSVVVYCQSGCLEQRPARGFGLCNSGKHDELSLNMSRVPLLTHRHHTHA